MLQQGVALQEDLIRSDPTNPQWKSFAAPNYDVIAVTLETLDRPTEALEYFQKSFDVRKELVMQEPDNIGRLQQFSAAANALGKRSSGLPRIEAYRDAVEAWKRVTDQSTPPASVGNAYDNLIAFAQAFDAAADWRDARTAYLVAIKMAQLNLANNSADATWRDKADQARKGAEAAAAALESKSAAPPPDASPPAASAPN
jgi:tetratricopeptide (TPR) repeat protein